MGLYGLVWYSREQGGGVALDPREKEEGVVGVGSCGGGCHMGSSCSPLTLGPPSHDWREERGCGQGSAPTTR